MSAGQDDARLGQQLFDLDLQRRVSPFVALASRDHAFPFTGKSLSQLWQPIPESKRQTGSRARGDRDGAIIKNRLCVDEETETQRERERQQRQIGDHRREAVQLAAVLAFLDNAVIGTGAISKPMAQTRSASATPSA